MRFQGRITTWKDEQGFGFVTPNGGGDPVFLHIRSFSNASTRPTGNELVTYELMTDERGRPRAIRAAFVGESRIDSRHSPATTLPLALAVLFLGLIVVVVVLGKLPATALGIYAAASTVAFFAYGLDKSAALNERRRTSERTLHMFGLVGGWPGALLAQKAFRHKCSKQEFQTVFRLTVVLNCVGLVIYMFLPRGLL